MKKPPVTQKLSLAAIRAKNGPLPPSLTRWTGYLLNRAGQLNREYFDALLAPLNLTSRAYTILALLEEAQPLAQIEIAERLRIDKNMIVTLLNSLESHGYAERQPDLRDKRAHAIVLTEAGRAALTQATEFLGMADEETVALLDADERAQLHALLLRLV